MYKYLLLVLAAVSSTLNSYSQNNRQKVIDAVSVPYSTSASIYMYNRIYSIGYINVGSIPRPTLIQQDIELKPVGFFFETLTRPNGFTNKAEILTGIVRTSDNNLMLVGSNGITGDAAIWVVKMDTLENVIWERDYKTSDYQAASKVIANDNGGFLMAGHLISPSIDPIHLLNVDVNGDTIWTKKLVSNSGVDLRIQVLFRENNGDYIIGNKSGFLTQLSRVNPSGNLIDNYYYSDGVSTDLYITGGMNDGQFTYYFGEMIGGDWTSFIMKTDNNGNVIWCKNYPDFQYINSMNKSSTGDLIVNGKIQWGPNIYKIQLMKIDTSGAPIVAKAYGQLPYSHNIYSNVALPNNKYLFGGDRNYQGNKTSYQIVVDENLNSGSCYEQIFQATANTIAMNKIPLNEVAIQPLANDFTFIGAPSPVVYISGVAKVDYDIDNSIINTISVIGDDCGGTCNGTASITSLGGNPGYNYLWSNNQSGNTASGLCGGSTISVRTSDQLGCNRYDSFVIQQETPVNQICVVTVDSTSTKNLVVWEKPISSAISGFSIYRDVVGNYSLVGYVPYDSLSRFIDNTNGINPNITSYRYKIKTIDTCGNESLLSDYHKTIHLTVNQGFNNTVNLIWDNYFGFTYSYNRILRDSIGNGNWQILDSVANNVFTWTDFNPALTPSNYMIEVVLPSTCVATRAENHNSSRSNRGTLNNGGPNGIFENETLFAVYPNPSSGTFSINQTRQNESIAVSIIDATGRFIQTLLINPGINTVDLSHLANGLYIIQSDILPIQNVKLVVQKN